MEKEEGSALGTGMSRRQIAATALGCVAGTAAALACSPAAAAGTRSAVPVADRLDIEDLFSSYVWAYDCSDEQAFAELFTADALVVGKGTEYRGEAILGWFRHLVEMREHEGDDTWMHEAGQFRFFRSGSSWLVFAYATHFNSNTAKGTRGVRSLGYFACECRREGGSWKFHRFSISAWDRGQLPWKKPLPWAGQSAAPSA